jgi:hypothetical protein
VFGLINVRDPRVLHTFGWNITLENSVSPHSFQDHLQKNKFCVFFMCLLGNREFFFLLFQCFWNFETQNKSLFIHFVFACVLLGSNKEFCFIDHILQPKFDEFHLNKMFRMHDDVINKWGSMNGCEEKKMKTQRPKYWVL